jgi:phosphoribosylformimino-5-aminoimidazole carboxamide ribotide isomerase
VVILPAIDLRGGQCVRLRQGDFSQETVFGTDPVAVAQRWVEQGAAGLHLVDLDGARAGQPVNGSTIQQIVSAVGVPCQVGGGIRTGTHIDQALSWGAARVVIGTRALKDPSWLEDVCRRYSGRIMLSVDARDGQVATDGWQEVSNQRAVDVARRCAAWPLAGLVYTDIGRDGMLAGPNLQALRELTAAISLPIFASGGITTLEDIRELSALPVAGCIVGRALYEGRLALPEASTLASASRPAPRIYPGIHTLDSKHGQVSGR